MTVTMVTTILVLACALFALMGVLYSRRISGSTEDYITARGSLGTVAGSATIVATGLGAWILFVPPETGTWGGIAAITGYALGAGAVGFAFIPLGRRMREIMPEGHSLTEYLWHRFGGIVYLVTLVAMVFYMGMFLTAELTAVAGIVQILADVPLWLSASVVMAATLLYTLYGGLRASVFTDGLQLLLILPVLIVAAIAGWMAVGGASGVSEGLAEKAAHLADISFLPGIQGGIALFLAVLLTNLFHQGYWQRVFASRDEKTLNTSFAIGGVISGIAVFAMGLFGLAFVASGLEGAPSGAMFAVLFEALPNWLILTVLAAGIALVMSSADTILNAISSLIVVDMGRALPNMGSKKLLQLSRILILVASIPIVAIASQGYGVLYLFLIADLVCAALAFPVFFGLYNARYTWVGALVSIAAGLAVGLIYFPDPTFATGSLWLSFVLAFAVPIAVSAVSLIVPMGQAFVFDSLRTKVGLIAK